MSLRADPFARMASVVLRLALLVLAIHSVPNAAQAQPGMYSSKDKKAIKLYESGGSCMRQQKWECAEEDLKKAALMDPGFIEPRIYLAEMFEGKGRSADALIWWSEVVAIAPKYFTPATLHLAQVEFELQKFDEAELHFRQYLTLEDEPIRKARALLGIENCAFAREAVKHPVPFSPKNLGKNVNTKDPEYYPCITADNATLLFTRRVEDPSVPYGMQEDFYVSDRTDSVWSTARTIPSVDTRENEGAGTLSPDGRFIIFTKCAGVDGSYGDGIRGAGSCDLFISRRIGERWTKPDNLGTPVNSRNWESQPSLASDGKTLYFVRATQAGDGLKGMDIYVSTLGDDGAFGKPEPLGKSINTPFQEESVQIHPDGRTLYFSSDGHPGMGGLDIFVSRMKADGAWGEPENLGYPINTSGDENSVLVGSNGEVAYFASDRPGGMGDLDLYEFSLPESARASAVNYIHGKVTDKSNGKPVEADVQLIDLATEKLATAAYSDPKTGEFLVCLPVGRDYALNASAEGYLFFSQNYGIAKGSKEKPFVLDVPLSPITAGSTIALRNIFFNTASAEILPASNTELDILLRLMKGNPTMRIEVGGHTDNVGADAENQKLSEQRAQAVAKFITGYGIDVARVTSKGYGEAKPLGSNETEEGRAQNRRTEITVL
ncbi:MAG: PD40 domain-containing protein [Flavobacteriales bacterium]|nr:PD40 domain-containing protein [Flavobacteriales bacterium]